MKKILVVLLVSIFIFAGCSNSEENYKLEGDFASTTEPYSFAVEVDDYDGDVFAAGYYSFISTATNDKAGVYNIYVLNEDVEDVSSLNDMDTACVAGGEDAVECSLEVAKGNYVYIVPQTVEYDIEGFLQIRKISSPFY